MRRTSRNWRAFIGRSGTSTARPPWASRPRRPGPRRYGPGGVCLGTLVRTTDLAFSGFVLLIAVGYEAMALWMPQGSLKFPGPGYYPALVGIFLLATSLGCLIQALLARRSVRSVKPVGAAAPRPMVEKTVALFGLLLGYGFVLTPLGFPIAICLFLLAAIRVFAYRARAT